MSGDGLDAYRVPVPWRNAGDRHRSVSTLEPPVPPVRGGIAMCRTCSPDLLPRQRCSSWPADKNLDDLTDEEVMGLCPYDAHEELRRRMTYRAEMPPGHPPGAQEGLRWVRQGIRSRWRGWRKAAP